MEPQSDVILEVELQMVLKVGSQSVTRLGDSEVAVKMYTLLYAT